MFLGKTDKTNLDLNLILYTKINSKWVTDFNIEKL
jgi:hypothetical protein